MSRIRDGGVVTVQDEVFSKASTYDLKIWIWQSIAQACFGFAAAGAWSITPISLIACGRRPEWPWLLACIKSCKVPGFCKSVRDFARNHSRFRSLFDFLFGLLASRRPRSIVPRSRLKAKHLEYCQYHLFSYTVLTGTDLPKAASSSSTKLGFCFWIHDWAWQWSWLFSHGSSNLLANENR